MEAATANVAAVKEAIPANAAATEAAIDADFAQIHALVTERHTTLKTQLRAIAGEKEAVLVAQQAALQWHHATLAHSVTVAAATAQSGHTLHVLVVADVVEARLRTLGARDWPEPDTTPT